MADNTVEAPKKKKLIPFGKSKKKVGSSKEPCPVSLVKERQLTVGVCATNQPGIDGVTVKITDAKGRKASIKTSGGGLVSFAKKAVGPCQISIELTPAQGLLYRTPAPKTVTLRDDGAVTTMMKLEGSTLDVGLTLACAAPIGLFKPPGPNGAIRLGELIALSLTATGVDSALDGSTFKLTLGAQTGAFFSDAAGLNQLAPEGDVIPVDGARLKNGGAVQIWARSAQKTPIDLIFESTPKPSAPRAKKDKSPYLGATVATQSAPLSIQWREPVDIVPALAGDTAALLGATASISCSVTDPDAIGDKAVLSILDNASVVVRTFPEQTVLTAPWTQAWDCKDDASALVALDRGPFQLKLDATDRYGRVQSATGPFTLTPQQSFLTLQFQDPDGAARALPAGLPVNVVYTDGTIESLKLGADGALLGTDGNPGTVLHPEHGKLQLRFPLSDNYVVCEPPGQPVVAAQLKNLLGLKSLLEDPSDVTKIGSRAFLLPGVEWGLKESSWAATGDGGRFDAIEGAFTEADQPLGTATTPLKLVLDPRWQYARFTYQDRVRGGAAQVSSLPLFVEGHAVRPAAPPPPSGTSAAPPAPVKPDSRSNWTLGATPELAVQCLPWILKTVTVGTAAQDAPSKSSELRFATAEHTFIETPKDPVAARVWSIGTERNTPGADRVRFYDLPKEWRSHNWYVRKAASGRDATGQHFGELATTAEVLATKVAPLIFSLDDIVLYGCADPTKPEEIAPIAALTDKQPIAVFHRSFAKGDDGTDSDLTAEGLYLQATCEKGTQAKVSDIRWPASTRDVFVAAGTGTLALKENYIKRYPDWTRLVIVEGNAFDVFAQRSSADDTADRDRVVGARAAVRFVDVTKPHSGVRVAAGVYTAPVPMKPGRALNPRPASVKTPFFTAQQLVESINPQSNRRLDFRTCGTKGTVSTDPLDFGTTQGRDTEVLTEASTPLAENLTAGIGRQDNLLLRCCGVEDDGKIEKAIQFCYMRATTDFKTSVATTIGQRRDWIVRCITGLNRRWNGLDGIYNTGRLRIEPLDLDSRTDKFSIEPVRFFQHVCEDLGAIRYLIVANSGGRDYMGTYYGETQSQDGKEIPSTGTTDLGRFTAGHEMGHGTGLLDDYCERSNHASYFQPGVPMLNPGDPYMFDDTDLAESMMSGNKVVRERHSWQLVEWVHAQLPAAVNLGVRRGTGKLYSLPHHASTRTGSPTGYRSYLTYPWRAVLDMPGPVTTDKARCDAYLWVLGDDDYSRNILITRSGAASGQAYDGVLVIAVAMCIRFEGNLEHTYMKNACSQITATLRATFSQRVACSLEVAGRRFENCLVIVSPRILVGSHANDPSYNKTLGVDKHGKAPAWLASTAYPTGQTIKPTVDNEFVYVVESVADPMAAPATQCSDATEPTWPTAENDTVVDGQLTWKAVPCAKVLKTSFTKIITDKVKINPMHVSVDMTASVSDLRARPGMLPEIRIMSQKLQVFEAGMALATAYAAGQVETLESLAQRSEQLNTEIAEAVEAQELAEQKVQRAAHALNKVTPVKSGKESALNLLGATDPKRPALELTVQRLTQRVSDLNLETTNAQNDKLAAEQVETDKTNEFNEIVEWGRKSRIASSVIEVLNRADLMAAQLFTATTNPLTDTGYGELCDQAAALTVAVDDDRDKILAKITSTRVPAAQLKLAVRNALCPATSADLTVEFIRAFANVATKIREWAALGADDPEKKQRAADARDPVTKLKAQATRAKNRLYAAAIVGADPSDLTDDGFICEKEADIHEDVLADMRTYYRKLTPATREEQLRARFGEYLGLSVDVTQATGYKRLVDAVAGNDSTHVWVVKPPDVPLGPPPTLPVSTAVPSTSGVTTSLLELIKAKKTTLTSPPPSLPPLADYTDAQLGLDN